MGCRTRSKASTSDPNTSNSSNSGVATGASQSASAVGQEVRVALDCDDVLISERARLQQSKDGMRRPFVERTAGAYTLAGAVGKPCRPPKAAFYDRDRAGLAVPGTPSPLRLPASGRAHPTLRPPDQSDQSSAYQRAPSPAALCARSCAVGQLGNGSASYSQFSSLVAARTRVRRGAATVACS